MSRKLTRREFTKITLVGLAAAGAVAAIGRLAAIPPDMKLPDTYPVLPEKNPAVPPYNKNARFFNEHQYVLVAALASVIVPTDDTAGAAEAGVADYVDTIASKSEEMQKLYKDGLLSIDKISRRKFGKDYVQLDIARQIDLLRFIDNAEAMRVRPASNIIKRIDRKLDTLWDDRFGAGACIAFFRKIRTDVFYGYYSSPVSWKVVGFYGPPQPVGYPDFAEPPSDVYYTGSIRTVDDKTCTSCHFTQTEKPSHRKRSSCTQCHPSHFDPHGGDHV